MQVDCFMAYPLPWVGTFQRDYILGIYIWQEFHRMGLCPPQYILSGDI